MGVPNKRLKGLLGTLKLTNPISTAGFTTTTLPFLFFTCMSVVMRRGWLLGGFPPITNTRSACSTSSRTTVAVPLPIALLSPTPLA